MSKNFPPRVYRGFWLEKSGHPCHWYAWRQGVRGHICAMTLQEAKDKVQERIGQIGFTPANPSLGYHIVNPNNGGIWEVKGRSNWLTRKSAQRHCDLINALKCRANLAPCFVEED